jgi:hypothetical protein
MQRSEPSALRKAGLPTAAVIIVALAGAPGFWEFFGNTTDDEAKAKAEVGYQLLRAQAEAQARQIEQQRGEVDALRAVVNQMLLQRAAGVRPVAVVREVPTPAALPATLDGQAAVREVLE